ncbi:MAG: methyltransferase [Bacteroidetes bacterium]|jgi:tRNA1Val (adenine37-N6)-methyltransferase|nr:methyltransferase [Bacteroidota bacterium]
MKDVFQFKQFTVAQNQCAMKVGTDGVLLGAWTPLNNPNSILDIGTGTGLIALQLAQRSDAELIDAIEIEDKAYEQCVENFENSPWSDRLFCYHASFEEFVEEIDDRYDLIVSNPPFFSETQKSGNESRDKARFLEALPFEELISGVSQLLEQNGIFSVIIPRKEEAHFIAIASNYKLFPNNICRVKGNEKSEEKRSLIAFARTNTTPKTDTVIIETSRHKYTKDYINLVRDFYLKMD